MENRTKGYASRSLPQAQPDTTTIPARFGRYGDQYIVNLVQDYYGVADEGSYFVATNPTVGTGITFAVNTATSFNDTTGAGLLIQNTDANPSSTIGKRIFLDYIKLICTAAVVGASASPFYQMAGRIDSTSRYSSGGSLIVPVNANMDASNTSICKPYFGALTLTSPSAAARTVFRTALRGATLLPGVNDILVFNFGSVEKAVGNQNISAAAGASLLYQAPPVTLGPGQAFSLHGWTAATFTTAPSFEFEIGWVER